MRTAAESHPECSSSRGEWDWSDAPLGGVGGHCGPAWRAWVFDGVAGMVALLTMILGAPARANSRSPMVFDEHPISDVLASRLTGDFPFDGTAETNMADHRSTRKIT